MQPGSKLPVNVRAVEVELFARNKEVAAVWLESVEGSSSSTGRNWNAAAAFSKLQVNVRAVEVEPSPRNV
jgi:hypothetical protein